MTQVNKAASVFQVPIIDVISDEAIFEGEGWDAVVVVATSLADIKQDEVSLLAVHASQIDMRVGKSATLLFAPGLAGGRLIISPVVDTGNEYNDVRIFATAAREGIAIAKAAGATKPLLVVPSVSDKRFVNAEQVAALACGQELWQPLEAREAKSLQPSLTAIGLLNTSTHSLLLNAAESGRVLARDLCGTEPERMSAIGFAQYCVDAFAGSDLAVSVVDEAEQLKTQYPLLSAVGRSSFDVARHHPRVVKLEYVGEGPITKTLFFAGKGVVYDTGGADIKVAGSMAGMSRDKGGAATVAGLMKALSILKPKGIKVVAELGLVRNSIGSDAFVTDEIITSHAGVRVRIGNTDAEGRLVLVDLLSHLRLQAQTAVNPQLFSVATLTGHVVRAYGGYPALIENSAAKNQGIAATLAEVGQLWGEPFEVSRLRPEDFDKVADKNAAADVVSSNNGPSSITARGHQYPAAFLIKASGLTETELAFTHIDIAGSAVEGDPLYGKPTASPLVALLQFSK
ncbi:M17 family metallopeptidase [Shewanella livingstonensis]|uniref:Leucyl aminopeptidase family protein n=1 Tax=Shewanella livingstonensis TaxID=150120 RepID=A0A3G8LS73_9GAMM|nr:leucyl aminopeptidase family protein [Shewanella livingstonensis]AZG72456.1 leucyl aminopeptidase family protein [Shewanella livingstonensis]